MFYFAQYHFSFFVIYAIISINFVVSLSFFLLILYKQNVRFLVIPKIRGNLQPQKFKKYMCSMHPHESDF